MSANPWWRAQSARLVGLACVVLLYSFARLPAVPEGERLALASQFRFERLELPELEGPWLEVREVHPSLRRIAAWVSATGASVALADLDGDGLPNDACHVDPRVNRALVAPLPESGTRFEPFTLDAAPLPFDPPRTAVIGCLSGDFNEDGFADLLAYYWGRSPVLFLRRVDPGSGAAPLAAAAFRPFEVVSVPEVWNTDALVQADVDGDGHLDLVIGNYFQDGAMVLDAEGEGRIDMQTSMSRATNGGTNRVLLWAGGVSGSQPAVGYRVAREAFDGEVAGGWTLALAAQDLDGDLLPELYFANDFGADRLLHNRSRPGHVELAPLFGRKEFTTPNSKVLGRDSFKGMGVDFGDLDGDGWIDIYVSNIAQEYSLEESHFAFINQGDNEAMQRGIAPFADRSEDLGLSRSGFSWEARLGDFNNDGVLEALQATGFVRGEVDRWPELQELALMNDLHIRDPGRWPRFAPGDDLSGRLHNPFFVRSSSGRFVDLAAEVGIDEVHVSRGIATADVDGDGDLDFALANQWDRSFLYRNEGPAPGDFLGLNLLLPVGSAAGGATRVLAGLASLPGRGRPAVGAAATVHLPDGRRLTAQVSGGNGHSGASAPALHFGLGRAAGGPLRVDVKWRDATGTPRQERLELTSGWHTVLLASGED